MHARYLILTGGFTLFYKGANIFKIENHQDFTVHIKTKRTNI